VQGSPKLISSPVPGVSEACTRKIEVTGFRSILRTLTADFGF
jgi:hypothetical protein